MALKLEDMRTIARAAFPCREPGCAHPPETVGVIVSTCGRIDAKLVQCTRCGVLLQGVYFCDDDNCTIPTVDFEPDWVAGPNYRRWGPSMARTTMDWNRIKHLVPDLVPMRPGR